MMLLALVLAAGTPAETRAESPGAWMEHVYAQYRRSPDFSPFTHPDHYFAPTLLAAINEDSRLAHGEVGTLDGDPICQCQDSGGMRPRVLKVTRPSAGKASVMVLIDWQDSTARKARFSLVRVRGGWRIADVRSGDERSLLQALLRANREVKKGRHAE
jgi:hypothetical protein